MSDRPFMVTLLPSSDVDLGRWLLHHWGWEYDERPHAPIFHILALAWWGVGKNDYPLLIRNGEKFPAIKAIALRWDPEAPPEKRLVPDPKKEPDLHAEVMDLQHRMRFDMGTGTVHWAYYNFLQHKAVVWPSLTTGVPWYETAFLKVGYPIIKGLMFKGLGLGPEDAKKALATVHAAWDEIDERLSDGRRFLCGDRLTLADLAFSTSGGPMVLARGYGGHLPPLQKCPADMRSVIEPLQARLAGQFIQRIYDDYRLS